ncbi:MAG TPA: hypothetical protein VFT07_01180 [Sphingomicrobium sp.]|jgi:hypothetical protein|nr:hypothetical protein [Sphingomicrobium sp.]
MIMNRRAVARTVSSFGRRTNLFMPGPRAQDSPLSDDLRLFALTFAGGFLFVSVYLA